MNMSSGFDGETLHTPARVPSMSYPHAASSSSAHTPQEHSMQQQTPTQSSQPKFSSGPHIRSRITVVCAECKRLKLKCDRRTPCSSCLKRDTVTRCVYSQAAAEKIDVQSLHNRILVLEGVYAKLSSAPPSTTLSSVLNSLPTFKEPFPSSMSVGSFAALSGLSGSGSTPHITGPLAGQPSNDRALLVTGSSGSSVVISLEDVSSIWLGELDDLSVPPSDSSAYGHSNGLRIKLEPTPVLMPPTPSAMLAQSKNLHDIRSRPTKFISPVPYETFVLSAEAPSTHVVTSSNLFPPSEKPVGSTEPPQVTLTLLARLPPADKRAKYMKTLEETMMLHPCFNVRHFEQRVDAMFIWGESGPSTSPHSFSLSTSGSANGASDPQLKALAQEVFFGQPPALNGKASKAHSKEQTRTPAHQPSFSCHPKPTLSFFAAAAAALALGALVCQSNEAGASDSPPADPTAPVDGSRNEDDEDHRCDPATLFALSDQALGLFERTAVYDLDMVIAMILQILYQLHDGQTSVAQGVFPLVGKMINVARMMGLAIDPDEFPGTYNLFESETRRRIWWDVFYYDLFVSDCMGHPPLIPDNSFTTRMPAEVDEEHFSPSSTTLPTLAAGDSVERSTAYFVLKCRLAQLVKNVKKQTFRDPLTDDPSDLSVDQAAAFEADIAAFLSELPSAFRLELDQDVSEPVHPPSSVPLLLQAQKCELAILANRLILKLYLPFLKESGNSLSSKPSHQAVLGTINAAHMIIYASRMLHAVWRQTRPAAFDFYDFGRTLFDAAIVCAHAVIQQPTTILAAEALKSVGCALDLMRELGNTRAGIEGVRGESSRNEAIRIVEMMKRKAENARASNLGNVAAGTKRKRSLLDDDRSSGGFQLPFVGASVSSVKPDQPRSVNPKLLNTPGKDTPSHDAKSKSDSKKQAKEKPIGIRARPPQGPPPSSRPRTSSISNSGPPSAGGRAEPSPSSAGATSSSSSHSVMKNHPRSAVPDSPNIAHGFDGYARPPHTPVQELQRDDYPMHYGSSDDSGMVDRRRFSSQPFSDSPQAPSVFDQASLSHPSPASYNTGPTPPNYYSYPPPPGPPSGYDNSSMGHPQSLPPMAGLTPPASIMDTPASAGGMSMSSMSHPQYLQYDKGSYDSHLSRPSEHTRQMPHDYHPPPTSQSIPMSGSHGWLPSSEPGMGGDMWNEYKYTG